MESPVSPILVKELRCTSRRARFYAMRACYVAALAIFTAVVWTTQVSGIGGGTSSVAAVTSRMADAGRYIVDSIAWFQFVAAQIIAALLLSTAISGEITKRTLPALLTTPLSYSQIAMGKVLAGASHVVILVICSLPLLAIVRVFGGVPWSFVISSIAVTITAAIFAAAMSLHYSILFRQPFASGLIAILAVAVFNGATALPFPINVAMLLAFLPARNWFDKSRPPKINTGTILPRVIVLILAFGVVPVAFWLASTLGGWMAYDYISRIISPASVMYFSGEQILKPQNMLLQTLPWVHCAIMLLLTQQAISRSAMLLERVAHRQACGEDAKFAGRPLDELETLQALHMHVESIAISRQQGGPADMPAISSTALATMRSFSRCKGNPVLWKDLKGRLFHNEMLKFIFLFLPIGLAVIFYGGLALSGAFWDGKSQGGIIAACMVVIGTLTAITASMAITSERQSRTWPVLLTTTMSNGRILFGKLGAVLLRGKFLWGFLCLHLAIFVVLQSLSPIAIIHVVPLTAAMMLFICGLAFLVGTFVRQNTVSVIVTLGALAALWLLSPVLGDFVRQMFHTGPDVGALIQSLNPFKQVTVLVAGDGGLWSKNPQSFLKYYWPGLAKQPTDLADSTLMMVWTSLLYAAVGAALAGAACRRFRKIAF